MHVAARPFVLLSFSLPSDRLPALNALEEKRGTGSASVWRRPTALRCRGSREARRRPGAAGKLGRKRFPGVGEWRSESGDVAGSV
jgi:hypothetical protein